MALIKWEPRRELEPFRNLREEVDRLFDSFFRGWPRPWTGEGLPAVHGDFSPSIDLKETEQEYVLTAELPGITKENLDVNITEDSVTIRGERKEKKQEEAKERGYYYRESVYGSFQRVIPLPAEVVAAEVKAKLKDGVLTLNLPKAKVTRSKGVQIKVE